MYVNAKSTLLHSQLHGNGWNVLEYLWMEIEVLFYICVCVCTLAVCYQNELVLRCCGSQRKCGCLAFYSLYMWKPISKVCESEIIDCGNSEGQIHSLFGVLWDASIGICHTFKPKLESMRWNIRPNIKLFTLSLLGSHFSLSLSFSSFPSIFHRCVFFHVKCDSMALYRADTSMISIIHIYIHFYFTSSNGSCRENVAGRDLGFGYHFDTDNSPICTAFHPVKWNRFCTLIHTQTHWFHHTHTQTRARSHQCA